MASLHKEIFVAAPVAQVWDAIRDVGALHTRLVPGFVVDTQLDGETRIVTFGNGATVREPIISIDDARRRLVWGAVGGRTTHYNAVMEAISEGAGTRVVWTTDLLPHELAPMFGGMQDQGLQTLRATLEAAAPSAGR
jgi:carbon monoxide dehydrogenase subunit G